MSTASTRRKSRRTKRVRYAEESDDDLEMSTPPRSQPNRHSRMAYTERMYREDSDESEDSDFDVESEEEIDLVQIEAPQRSTVQPQRQSTQSRKRKRPITRSSKYKSSFQLFKRRKPNTGVLHSKPNFQLEVPRGRIPPWQTLPYHVLLNIMKEAAYPLYGKASRASASINWLCDTSLLCKSFHEACSAALLFSPPLYPSFRAHGLLQLLEREPETTSAQYRNLVKCLDIEAKNLLVKKTGVTFDALILRIPLLQKLRIYHNHDDLETLVWAQPGQAKGKKWSYPSNLADMLDQSNIKLTSFEWNGRFAAPSEAMTAMVASHSHSSFASLQDLAFLNMTLPEKHTEEDVKVFTEYLLNGLKPLTALRSLTFRNCDMLTEAVMSRLPPGLTSLEISSCTAFTSDQLTAYLSSHGSSLLSLRLIKNQSMSLGFISGLKTFCPHLQDLYIDLAYVDSSSYRDINPLYDELLPNGQPTWPTSLVNVELEYLRQFSAEDAEGFFQSLASSAPDLYCLKRLSIKAIVQSSWKERAQMRQKWVPKLEDVFLNRSEPSKFYLPVRTSPKKPHPESEQNPSKKAIKESRRSGRIKDVLLRREQSDSYSQVEEDRPRTGTCNIVKLELSDQRPSQDQFKEADFLDDELEGDEEYQD